MISIPVSLLQRAQFQILKQATPHLCSPKETHQGARTSAISRIMRSIRALITHKVAMSKAEVLTKGVKISSKTLKKMSLRA